MSYLQNFLFSDSSAGLMHEVYELMWILNPQICICYIPQVIYSDEERRFNRDITVGLIRSELMNLSDYNVQLAKLIDGGRNSK